MAVEVAEEARREASAARITVMRTVGVVTEEVTREVEEAIVRVVEAMEAGEDGQVEATEEVAVAGEDLPEPAAVEAVTMEAHQMTGGKGLLEAAVVLTVFCLKIFYVKKTILYLVAGQTHTWPAASEVNPCLCPSLLCLLDVPDLTIDLISPPQLHHLQRAVTPLNLNLHHEKY